MKRQAESLDEFRTRINAEENGHSTSGNDDNWLLGATQRHKGSLHQDVWRGPAADLAVAIWPFTLFRVVENPERFRTL